MLSPSAVLPPAKVRFPLPIVMAPPDQEPNVFPDPPLKVTLAWLSISTLPMIWPLLVIGPIEACKLTLWIASPIAPPFVPRPPSIVPRLASGPITPEFDIPAPPAPPNEPPAPPLIVPLLVSVAIVPEFATPAPPDPSAWRAPPFPPRIVPLLVSVWIVPEFTTPAPPAPTMLVFCPAPPAPPMTLPLLASDPIIPAFQTPAPPVPALKTPLPPAPPTIAPR